MEYMSGFRTALRWSWLLVLAAALYAGVTMFLRYEHNRSIDNAAARQTSERNRRIYEQLGAGEVKIVTFYANPPVLRPGASGSLCYGVSNATEVRIEPPLIEPTPPVLSRCVEVRPQVSTTYTLSASGAQGANATQQVQVLVQ